MMIILGSTINIIGEVGGGGEVLYDPLMSMQYFTLMMNKIFIRTLKNMMKMTMTSIQIC